MIVEADLAVSAEDPNMIRGKRVLVVEDGPTLTHGGMPSGAGLLCAEAEGAAFIVDPKTPRPPADEMVMVMNGFDTNFDEENEIYAVNTVAHTYMKRPIEIDRARPVRIYLINATEFDPINSFHIHGNFFDYYDHGTTLTPTLTTVDTVMQCQAQRGIIEMSFRDHEPGRYMFHAHQSEFAELGWMSFFEGGVMGLQRLVIGITHEMIAVIPSLACLEQRNHGAQSHLFGEARGVRVVESEPAHFPTPHPMVAHGFTVGAEFAR